MQINTKAHSKLSDAHDLLYETETMVKFVQSITLSDSQEDFEISLNTDQSTGLYYVLKNIIDNLKDVREKIDNAKKELKSHV